MSLWILLPFTALSWKYVFFIGVNLTVGKASLVVQMIKSLPATQETWVRSLAQEDPLKGMATHSSILAWTVSWIEKPGVL